MTEKKKEIRLEDISEITIKFKDGELLNFEGKIYGPDKSGNAVVFERKDDGKKTIMIVPYDNVDYFEFFTEEEENDGDRA